MIESVDETPQPAEYYYPEYQDESPEVPSKAPMADAKKVKDPNYDSYGYYTGPRGDD